MRERVLLGLMGVLLAGIGCRALQVPEAPPPATPLAPRWPADEVLRHLELFNDDEDGRATGSEGLERALAYVADRFREFLLQPGAGGTYRQTFPVPLNRPDGVTMTATGADTLDFIPGFDVMPDSRSDSGTVVLRRAVFGATGAVPGPDALVLLDREAATPVRLRAIRREGGRAVLIVGDLHPALAPASVPGLLVAQATRRAAARLLGVPSRSLSMLVELPRPIVRTLPRTLTLRINARSRTVVEGYNLLGFLAGRHPVHARELVVVSADLDDVGAVPGARVVDTRHLGQGAAALMELARAYSAFGDRLSFPDRSILFILFTGQGSGQAGLRAFLSQATWPRSAIHSWWYLAPDADTRQVLDTLRSRLPFPVHAVEAGEADRLPAAVLLYPEDTDGADTPGPPDRATLLEAAATETLALLDAVHPKLIPVVVSAQPPVIPPKDSVVAIPPLPRGQ